jgi:hypothetical protein
MLWPIEVVSAGLRDPLDITSGAPQAILIELTTFNNLKFSQLGWETLRFFLNGPSQHVFHLYELLLNNVSEIIYESVDSRGKSRTVTSGPDNIKPVGFDPDVPAALVSGLQFAFRIFLLSGKIPVFRSVRIEKDHADRAQRHPPDLDPPEAFRQIKFGGRQRYVYAECSAGGEFV